MCTIPLSAFIIEWLAGCGQSFRLAKLLYRFVRRSVFSD